MANPAKTSIDCETLLRWAYQDELSKRHTSAAEGIWDRITQIGQQGGIDPGHGAAQRYAHFGLPDPDAERIEQAVGQLEDLVLDWKASFATLAGDLASLISVNDLSKRESPLRSRKAGWGEAGAKALKAWWGSDGARPVQDRPRDVLLVGGLRTGALVTMHAVRGTRPNWIADELQPHSVPAAKGPNAMIVGECRGRNLYSTGAHCPLRWEPSPLSIVSSRAEYAAWHAGLLRLAGMLELEKFIALPPKVSGTPWLDVLARDAPEVRPVMPNAGNSAADWGTLPLSPVRGRMGPALRQPRGGPVRYPLADLSPA